MCVGKCPPLRVEWLNSRLGAQTLEELKAGFWGSTMREVKGAVLRKCQVHIVCREVARAVE